MTQSLQGFLGSGDALGRLREHAERLRRLQAVLAEHLPAPLANTCSVGNLKGDTLVLIARNGTAAARLNQLLPSIMQHFGHAGVLIGKVQVKVSIGATVEPRPPVPVRIIGERGRDSLAELARSLPEDAPLRASLQRLIDHCRSN